MPLSRASSPALATVLAATCLALSLLPPATPSTLAAPADDCKPRGDSAASGDRDCQPGTRRRAAPRREAETTASEPAPTAFQVDQEAGADDPLQSLGAGSPFCERPPAGRGARNCRSSGALAHPYPIGNYGFDIHIDTGVTRIESNLLMAVQTLALFCWLGLLYLVKGVLLLLEWAFSLDLLGTSLADARRVLLRVHHGLLGEPWLLLAIAAAGLWGIWRGLVQRQTVQTVTGLAVAVALMVSGLVLINSPLATVGQATKLTNDAALGLLSGASTGTTSDGRRALGDASAGLFDSLVLRPWCALEFGDVEFCLAPPPKDIPLQLADDARRARSVADLWLAYPAGGVQRNQLYEHWRGDGHPLQPKMRLQKQGHTGTRLALLVLIAAGMVGALCLLGWIAAKLLAQAVLALLLLLCAPAMLLAPAFGDSGRDVFIGWAKRLAGAIVAKAIYALLLALILATAGLLAELRSLGFIGLWLLQCVFWWSLFLHRRQVTGFLATRERPARQGRGLVRQARTAAAGWALGAHSAAKIAGTAAAPGRAVRRRQHDRSERKRSERQASAWEALGRHADRTHDIRLNQARRTLERDRELTAQLERTDRLLANHDHQAELAHATQSPPPTPSEDERALLAHRDRLRAQREPGAQLAQALVAAADQNLALEGTQLTPAQRDRLATQRLTDLRQPPSAGRERDLEWAGIDPREHRAASPAQQAHNQRQAAQAATRDGQLAEAVAMPAGSPRAITLAHIELRRRRGARAAGRKRQQRLHLHRRR